MTESSVVPNGIGQNKKVFDNDILKDGVSDLGADAIASSVGAFSKVAVDVSKPASDDIDADVADRTATSSDVFRSDVSPITTEPLPSTPLAPGNSPADGCCECSGDCCQCLDACCQSVLTGCGYFLIIGFANDSCGLCCECCCGVCCEGCASIAS